MNVKLKGYGSFEGRTLEGSIVDGNEETVTIEFVKADGSTTSQVFSLENGRSVNSVKNKGYEMDPETILAINGNDEDADNEDLVEEDDDDMENEDADDVDDDVDEDDDDENGAFVAVKTREKKAPVEKNEKIQPKFKFFSAKDLQKMSGVTPQKRGRQAVERPTVGNPGDLLIKVSAGLYEDVNSRINPETPTNWSTNSKTECLREAWSGAFKDKNVYLVALNEDACKRLFNRFYNSMKQWKMLGVRGGAFMRAANTLIAEMEQYADRKGFELYPAELLEKYLESLKAG